MESDLLSRQSQDQVKTCFCHKNAIVTGQALARSACLATAMPPQTRSSGCSHLYKSPLLGRLLTFSTFLSRSRLSFILHSFPRFLFSWARPLYTIQPHSFSVFSNHAASHFFLGVVDHSPRRAFLSRCRRSSYETWCWHDYASPQACASSSRRHSPTSSGYHFPSTL